MVNLNLPMFNVQISSPRGKYHDKRIEMALNYLEFLGTGTYSAEALRQEFYKMGVKLNTELTTPYQTVIEISGPQGRYTDAMDLLNHFLRDMKPDQKALKEYIARILKTRSDAKQNPSQNFQNAAFYCWYGKDNPIVQIPSEAEMIIFASQKGYIQMSLRNHEDSVVTKDLQSVNWKYLEDNLNKYNQERERRNNTGSL